MLVRWYVRMDVEIVVTTEFICISIQMGRWYVTTNAPIENLISSEIYKIFYHYYVYIYSYMLLFTWIILITIITNQAMDNSINRYDKYKIMRMGLTYRQFVK